MKIGIHHTPGSFSDRWIEYCERNIIPFEKINCFDSNIIAQVKDFDGIMWHWDLNDYRSKIVARQLTISLEKIGIKVFPNFNTGWHYDDKVGQKYLLESIGAPLVKTYVFYEKQVALNWADNTSYPKVFKLSEGASSVNVQLVRTKKEAKQLIVKSFSKGLSHINRFSRLSNRCWVLQRDKNMAAIRGILSGFYRLFVPLEVEKYSSREKGYVYFQDFIPDNTYDTRLVVVGKRCFGLRRYCRKNDFRASGSGVLAYNPDFFDQECIKKAFELAEKLEPQSIAFDFEKDKAENKIVEISYCYTMGKAYDDCPGYWDRNLNWHSLPVNPQYFIIEDFINECKKKAATSLSKLQCLFFLILADSLDFVTLPLMGGCV